MNYFDTFLDELSAKDLGRRMRYVIIFGIVMIALAIAGGYALLSKDIPIYLEGSSSSEGAENDVLSISIDHDQISMLPKSDIIEVEFMVPELFGRRLRSSIVLVKPTYGVIDITKPNEVDLELRAGRFDVRLYLNDAPMWKLLTSR